MENQELIQAMSQMLDSKMDNILNSRLDKILDSKLLPIHGSLDRIEGRLDRIEVTIENEIQPNIKLLAEGQLELVEKVKALEVNYMDLNEKIDLLIPATKRNSREINELKSL